MRIIRKRKIVDDDWVHLDDDAELPSTGKILVSLERWRAERDKLLQRGDPVGLRVPNTIDPREIAGDLPHLAAVAIEFPIYRDGRGFSVARLLRDRLAYRGEVRAIGNVLQDQLFFMERCGFDAYELQAGKNLESALEAFEELSVTYQDAIDPRSAPRRR